MTIYTPTVFCSICGESPAVDNDDLFCDGLAYCEQCKNELLDEFAVAYLGVSAADVIEEKQA